STSRLRLLPQRPDLGLQLRPGYPPQPTPLRFVCRFQHLDPLRRDVLRPGPAVRQIQLVLLDRLHASNPRLPPFRFSARSGLGPSQSSKRITSSRFLRVIVVAAALRLLPTITSTAPVLSFSS